MNILITGCAGFIGFHLSKKLLKESKFNVFGIDNLNKYYDVKLKKNRLALLKKNINFKFFCFDLSDYKKTFKNFKYNKYDIVVHLAAQAGVRYSIENPSNYVKDNLNAFFSVLDSSRLIEVKHLLLASTSSVYGDNKNFPLTEDSNTDLPLSFYAATKKSNEVMAYSYSNIYKLPCTILRFFTVYGPMGRPDMSLFKFVNSIFKNKFLSLHNKGNHIRDFTYINDVVEFIKRILNKPSTKKIPFEIYNIASSQPKHLKFFIKTIESVINKKAKIKYIPLQKGDIYKTHADITKISKKTSYYPSTKLVDGIKVFCEWFSKSRLN